MESNDPTVAKVMALIILCLGSIVCGILPIYLTGVIERRDASNKIRRTITSVLLCFGGGVLFATAFCHIIPEALELFNSAAIFRDKPVGEIVICCGFFLVYLVEELVHFFSDSHIKAHGNENSKQVHRTFSANSRPSCKIAHDDTTEATTIRQTGTMNSHSDYSHDLCSTTAIRDFVTVIALSFHAIFEGLAIGLETSSGDVWTLMGAVSAHKFVISFSFGLELFESGTHRTLHILYMTTFASMSALGILIGIAVSVSIGESKAYIQATSSLQLLSAGTLLYVAVFEVMGRERGKKCVNGLIQLMATMTGFVVMMSIDLIAPHHHDHGCDSDLHSHSCHHGNSHDHDHHDDHGQDDHAGVLRRMAAKIIRSKSM